MQYLDLAPNSRPAYPTASIVQRRPDSNSDNPHSKLLERSSRQFYGLTPDETSALIEWLGDPEVDIAGTVLAGHGSRYDEPRVLLKGLAAEQIRLSRGRRQFIHIMVPGEIWGLGKDAADVVALSDIAHASLNVTALVGNLPSRLSEAVWVRTALNLRKQIFRLGGLTAAERLAHLLLDIYRQFELIGIARDGNYEFPLTQQMLANLLGISSVHTSRILGKLRNAGFVKVGKGRCSLLNLAKLAAFAKYPGPEMAAEKVRNVEKRFLRQSTSMSQSRFL